ncbi:MAG: hypothetical protein HC934_02295 [Acaryochloridaceae cyanobacterium SU_2_1]|nr:hypothetical protein [Acaryochloridaceae cyanobacterium SU_2_1]
MKVVAVVTGAIALLLGVAYLLLVQMLDFRGEMLPAPMSSLQLAPPWPAELNIRHCPVGNPFSL